AHTWSGLSGHVACRKPGDVRLRDAGRALRGVSIAGIQSPIVAEAVIETEDAEIHIERSIGGSAKSDGVEPVAKRGVVTFGKPVPKTLHDGAEAQTARIEALHRVAAHHSGGVDKFENALAQRIGRNGTGDGRGLRQSPALI